MNELMGDSSIAYSKGCPLSFTNRDSEPFTLLKGALGALGNMNLDMLINMFASLGTRGFAAPKNSNVPPEELYVTQLAQLQEMGFFDVRENLQALAATAGIHIYHIIDTMGNWSVWI
uniref:Uncharacterized protein n=1 Tax=Tanacetum cinerariifolium TaxID=118510 RepID=A0A6L2LZG7_TANCI|nr:hypothetical protein [Tanacetum cinerariifolium]